MAAVTKKMAEDTANADTAMSSSASASENGEPSMVVTRTRRTNAGNRMAKLLAQEETEEQDEQAKQFYGQAEWNDAQDDDEFTDQDVEALEDFALDSSSEDGDEDAEEHADELAGEKVLQKQERAERGSKKRKITKPLLRRPTLSKKPKVTLASSTSHANDDHSSTPTVRSKRKSERVSWLPTAEDGPVRQSSRAQTVHNKTQMHRRLKEKEANRLALLAHMKAAEERHKKLRPEPMTQAERLALAAKVEEENIKTLNKWEEAEKTRQEEQRARLEALKNKRLEGPFIRWWSGPAVWVNDKLKAVGKDSNIANVERLLAVGEQPLASAEPTVSTGTPADTDSVTEDTKPGAERIAPALREEVLPAENPTPEVPPAPPPPYTTLDTIAEPLQRPMTFEEELRSYANQPVKQAAPSDGQASLHTDAKIPPSSSTEHHATQISNAPPSSQPPLAPPLIEQALRSLVTLRGFDLPQIPTKTRERDKDKEMLTKTLLEWPDAKTPHPFKYPYDNYACITPGLVQEMHMLTRSLYRTDTYNVCDDWQIGALL